MRCLLLAFALVLASPLVAAQPDKGADSAEPDRLSLGALGGERASLYGELFGPGLFASVNAELALGSIFSGRVGGVLMPAGWGEGASVNLLAGAHAVPGTGAYRPDFGVGVRFNPWSEDGLLYGYAGMRYLSKKSGAVVGLGGSVFYDPATHGTAGILPSVSIGQRF